jgi:hypothetical protein
MDSILRQTLYQELKKEKFENESSHVQLKFTMQFEIEDQSIQSFSLCERCYIIINQHKSKIKLHF